MQNFIGYINNLIIVTIYEMMLLYYIILTVVSIFVSQHLFVTPPVLLFVRAQIYSFSDDNFPCSTQYSVLKTKSNTKIVTW